MHCIMLLKSTVRLFRIRILFLAVALSLAASGASAKAEPLGPGAKRLDKNHNDLLEPDELPPNLKANFNTMDKDGDGALNASEIRSWFLGQAGRRQAGQKKRAFDAAGIANPTFEDVTKSLEKIVKSNSLPGAVFIVYQDGKEIFRGAEGEFTYESQLPMASATKWMTGAVIMSLVDRGLLDLDTPIGTYLPTQKGQTGKATLRQMLSHTSGLGGRNQGGDLRLKPTMTMKAAAEELLSHGMAADPGKVFSYGGVSMQIAGHIAEVVSGKTWREIFEEGFGRPLAMTRTYYGSPMVESNPDEVTNPNMQAGLFSTPADYRLFLHMIYEKGMHKGKRLLSESAVGQMETDQTKGAEKVFVPGGADKDWGYGIGIWCEVIEPDGTCPVISSPGAFGTYPWVDRTRSQYGLFVTKDRLPNIVNDVHEIRKLVNRVLDKEGK